MMKNFACLIAGMLLVFCAFSRTHTDSGNDYLPPGDVIQNTTPLSFCQGGSVVLSVTGLPGYSYQWQQSIDAGTTWANVGTNLNSYTANQSGLYWLIETTGGVSDTLAPVSVTVYANPVAGFTVSPGNSCGSSPISFTNTSTGTGLSYVWNFNDPYSGADSVSTLQNPTHHFIGSPSNGTQNFNVTLTVTNGNGCSNTFTTTVTTVSPSTLLTGPTPSTYNGLTYFTTCSQATSAPFGFYYTSAGSNSSYQIIWGDNTPNYSSTSIANPVSHTYNIGTYNMLFIVTSSSGCVDTGQYHIFVGSNPAVGLGNPGNTTICSGDSLTFPISGTSANPSGTIYTVSFNDNSAPVTFAHPAPSSITHLFIKGSCGVNSTGYPNSFSATIRASNPCLTSSASVVPIYVSQKPEMGFGIGPDSVVCVNTAVQVVNLSGTIDYVVNGSCSSGKSVWSISPATGWNITGGALGNDNGVNNPNVWTVGTNSVSLNFSVPGTYYIKLKGGNINCGIDSSIRAICINPAPVAAFALSASQGCAPLTVTTTNNSNTPLCKTNTYTWSVSYSNSTGCTPNTSNFTYLNSTSSTSAQPEFQFNNPGVYTITLVTRNSSGICTSAPVSQTVTVKAKPIVTITAPNSLCQGGIINPTATVINCYSSTAATYSWTFNGGTPSSSTSANPGSITYNTAGTHTISLTVTNECGSTTTTKNVIVNPAPDVIVPTGPVFCAGTQTGALQFSSSFTGTSYTWTNSNTAIGLSASGSGNIPNFTAINIGSTPITATITVIPTNGCPGPSQSFTITINPRSIAPGITTPVLYCLNETPSILTATPATNNTLTWYTTAALTNGSANAPTPVTTVAGSTTHYVTQTNGYNCESPAAAIIVTVHPLISGNTIVTDQTICTNGLPTALASQTSVSGGSGNYTYQWQQSTDGGLTWTNIPGGTAATYNPGSLSNTIKYRRAVLSSACTDTSNIVTITVQGTLNNIDIAASETICSGTTPSLIAGQAPAGGSGTFVYQWESSINNVSWTTIPGASGIDYQPPVLTGTTYYRRKTTSGQCSGYSTVVTVTVNPKPIMITIVDKIYCNGATVNNIPFITNPTSGITYAWTNDNANIGLAASGTGTLPVFTTANNSNPKVPLTGNVSVIPTYTNNSVSCAGNPLAFNITVLPTITINPVNDTSVCTGATIPSFTPSNDAAPFAGTVVTYNWAVSGAGIMLSNGSGLNLPAFNTNNSGTTDLTATITITPVYQYTSPSGNVTCNGTPRSYSVTVKPGIPPANAGTDTVLCAATSYTMQASQPANTSGTWTQLGTGTATIVNPSAATTQITGLVPGTVYQFVWTLAGFATCAPTKDTVVIKVDAQVVNTIDNTTQTICAGQSLTINGNPPTGGNGVYVYQWQQSTDNVNWTNLAGQTGPNLTFSPTQNIYVRRIVNSLPCFKESISTQIIVQPAITNNTISANQAICINTAASQINGALPSGGNSIYQYQWQFSTNGGATWTNITGAINQNYIPGALTVTTQFRRLVSTVLCAGPQASSSNMVTVTVNPDAKAIFNPTTTLGCVPFNITPAVINLQPFPSQNSQYIWYVNGVFLGSGAVFPGYNMTQADDTITIKLLTVSAFGCLNDSSSHDFHTYNLPQPSFTISDTLGCGPLTVQMTNTTPEMSSFAYLWNFGNGQTSTLPQPGNVIFLPNPTYGDTIYTVKLSVISACDTLSAIRTIRVKSKPKALFTPNNSVGCSPMTVTFNNTSPGIGNSYTWNFGDGSATVSTNAAGAISHTFNTGVQDTFYVKLVAQNDCGKDSLTYAIVVAPNAVHLDFAINGNQFSGCAPHTVKFINNSSGATSFVWNFADGNIISTTQNLDTVTHAFQIPGTYVVTLTASNGCSDTTSTETVIIYPKPQAAYTASQYTACIGDSILFTNGSTGATSYLWQFGDGATSTLTNPKHVYTSPGLYTVKLIAYSLNPSGTVCIDSTSHQVQIVSSLPGWFNATDTVGQCAPFTITFTNQTVPSVTANWNFGDGNNGSGNSVTHTFNQPGIYQVVLTVTVPGGCTYNTVRTVKVLGPSGTWTHSTGYLCNNAVANYQVAASNYDSLIYHFGDGTTLATTSNVVFHSYTNPGTYFPSVIIKNNAGCLINLPGIDSIKAERIKAGFTATQQSYCGYTNVNFTDTSHAFFGKAIAKWNFGDGNMGTGFAVSHNYNATGSYPVQLIITGNSGCSDTVTRLISVVVNSKPVAAIASPLTSCTNTNVLFNSTIQSVDPVNIIQWNLSNGVSNPNASFNYAFAQSGTYTVRLIAGTVNGCYDTTTATIQINPTPVVIASNNFNLCRGSSAPLTATGNGVTQWSWSPLQGLSCYNCFNPVASPLVTTPYIVEGTNSFGCPGYDTIVVTVIQPFNMTISSADSICIGESTSLLASGATAYSWSPPTGLNNTTIPNPTAAPTVTTTYRVVGYDGFNCFTDTAFVTVAVGQYPVVNLGPDLVLATGTQQQLTTAVQNGPITKWLWSPATDLSCTTCPLPTANIKKEISYIVKATTAYGCSDTDTISIKTFCQGSQVFIPNAFTPNGDGFNDVLMVRASGIALVKTFRVFNRWGEVVFEKGNFQPNDPQHGWNGKIKGVEGGPDVFVYTAEVVCENGTTFSYKGNVSILK